MHGESKDGNTSLNVLSTERRWGFLIRRSDRKADIRFGSLHEKKLSVDDIRSFLPDVNSMTFEEIPSQGPIGREFRGGEGDYTAGLFFGNDETFIPEKVVEDFKSIFG